jgi:DNA-binding sugar fermentation-stimulating protein
MKKIAIILLFIVLAANFVVGERWIQKYIVNNVSEFKGTTVTFEETLKAGETVRRIDVTASNSARTKIYYEFKSVSTVPPDNFGSVSEMAL